MSAAIFAALGLLIALGVLVIVVAVIDIFRELKDGSP